MAARRQVKEGVTAVSGAAGSAARKQPTQKGRVARVPQQSRVEPADAAVTLVPDDSAGAAGQPGGRRPGSNSRRRARGAAQKDSARRTTPPRKAGNLVEPANPAPGGPVGTARPAGQA